VFDAASRTTVAFTVLVRNPAHTGSATIHYRDIGDYLSRDDKLRIVAETKSIADLDAETIKPNAAGDWLDQRTDHFETYSPIGVKGSDSRDGLFDVYSRGIASARDAWVYNFGQGAVETNMRSMIKVYDAELDRADRGASANQQMIRR